MEKTRAQKNLIFAEKRVSEVETAAAAKNAPDKLGKTYGGLCHNFPVLIRTCGLCQAVAFSEAKAAGDDEKVIPRAHKMLLKHLGEFLSENGFALQGRSALETIRTADAMTYMLMTRQILAAWIFFKRFAVSILQAESAQAAEETEDSTDGAS